MTGLDKLFELCPKIQKEELLNRRVLPKNPLPQLNFPPANFIDLDCDAPVIGKPEELSEKQQELLLSQAKKLGGWRKGPLNLFGNYIDSEWRSFLKWNRIKDSFPPLEGKRILDIGCNNGYFMFRMLTQEPAFILGIDPVEQVKNQFEFINSFVKSSRLIHEMWGINELPFMPESFDVIFSMGILYHHPNPQQQLQDLYKTLDQKGMLILETIGIPGDEKKSLIVDGKYAGMKRISPLPTASQLSQWIGEAGFNEIQLISKEWDGINEQRSTEWCSKKSYRDNLEPKSKNETIEGHPLPQRFCFKASKK